MFQEPGGGDMSFVTWCSLNGLEWPLEAASQVEAGQNRQRLISPLGSHVGEPEGAAASPACS